MMHKCVICGYIYNPEEGDPAGGIEAGTSFDEIDPTWKCPLCGAGKSEFTEWDN